MPSTVPFAASLNLLLEDEYFEKIPQLPKYESLLNLN